MPTIQPLCGKVIVLLSPDEAVHLSGVPAWASVAADLQAAADCAALHGTLQEYDAEVQWLRSRLGRPHVVGR